MLVIVGTIIFSLYSVNAEDTNPDAYNWRWTLDFSYLHSNQLPHIYNGGALSFFLGNSFYKDSERCINFIGNTGLYSNTYYSGIPEKSSLSLIFLSLQAGIEDEHIITDNFRVGIIFLAGTDYSSLEIDKNGEKNPQFNETKAKLKKYDGNSGISLSPAISLRFWFLFLNFGYKMILYSNSYFD